MEHWYVDEESDEEEQVAELEQQSREYRISSELARRTAREFDEFRNKIDARFNDMHRTAYTNTRWLIGLLAVVGMAVIGSFVSIRVSIEHLIAKDETMVEHNNWQDKVLNDLDVRLRRIETYSRQQSN